MSAANEQPPPLPDPPPAAAPSENGTATTVPNGKFACDFPGCGKAFARSDYLSRHKLNHEATKIYACDRCSRTFVRADLLKRHAERHDKREQNGYEPAVKPGRIKGVPGKKPKKTSFANPPTTGTLEPLLAAGSPLNLFTGSWPLSTGSSVNSAYHTPVQSVSGSEYDHGRYTDLLAPQGPPSTETPATSMAIDFHGWNSQIPVPSLGQPSGLPNFSIPQAHNLPADSFYDSSVDLEQIMRTGAVASDNRDSPFLSASEAHWLFNNEGQRSVPMVQASPDEMDQPMAQTQAYMDPLPGRQSNASSDEGAPALPRSMSWPALNDRKTALPKAAPYLAPLIPPMPRQVVVTAAARDKMLDYFKDLPGLASDPRFDLPSLDGYIARFFEWDMAHWAIVHRPTFDISEAIPSLVAAMVTIGCHFTGHRTADLARNLHGLNWRAILVSPSFAARADLGVIQACFLTNVYGRLMSTFENHELAHIHYSSFLTMCKRSALFNARASTTPEDADLETRWLAWRDEEGSRRMGFAAYCFDIACSALFKQVAMLSAFQVTLTLPGYEDEWHAGSAAEWNRYHRGYPAPQAWLAALKAFLMPGVINPDISPLGRVICLHGLISVAFDMQWREYFLLGLSTHPDGLVKEWRLTLTSAYNCWKARFDSAVTSAPTAIGTQLLRNSLPLYAIAHCTLAVDVDELQIFAGKRRSLGLPVPPASVDGTKRRVIAWSGGRGKEAAWHAAHFLRSTILTRRAADGGAMQSMFASCIHNEGSANPMDLLEAICAPTPDEIDYTSIGRSTGLCEDISQLLLEDDAGWELIEEASRLLAWVGAGGEDA